MLAIALVALLCGCGGAAPAVTADPGIEDVEDTCTSLPRECIEGLEEETEDGCPDADFAAVTFVPGGIMLAENGVRQLAWLVADGRRLRAGVVVEIFPELAPGTDLELGARRASMVQDELVARGVPAIALRLAPARPLGVEGLAPDPARVIVRATGCPFP
jgi:hypothetical protein